MTTTAKVSGKLLSSAKIKMGNRLSLGCVLSYGWGRAQSGFSGADVSFHLVCFRCLFQNKHLWLHGGWEKDLTMHLFWEQKPNRACSGHNACLGFPGTTHCPREGLHNKVTVAEKTTAAWLTPKPPCCGTLRGFSWAYLFRIRGDIGFCFIY